MPTASLIKLPILVATYRFAADGEIDLDKPVALREEDKVPGSGILRDHFSDGATLPLRDHVRLMMRYSDNTATNIVIDQIGLPATTEIMRRLGLKDTRLHSKVYRGDTSIAPERSRQFGLGSTTASEMVKLLSMLHGGELGDETATREMLDHLLACESRSKLPRFFDDSIQIAHKTGSVSNCRTDAGIIYTSTGPVAVCVLTNENKDQSWGDDNAAEILCGQIGQAVLDRFDEDEQPASQVLTVGAHGRLVESLQRTLNARMDPSPNLAVDGDFGPATRGAVERFQREQSIPDDGVVNRATWEALGTLIEKDDPVPDPEVVNSEAVPKRSRPTLDDPPIVTCKAWVVGDSDGNVLWQQDANQTLEAASTTKIMTAHVVLKLARRQPEILREVITFSRRADETRGSTAGIRAGEKIEVEKLLYGLLLPSGNDAAVALAEHVGHHFAESSEEEPLDAFVREMNREATRLELNRTHYTNPHGLSNQDHVTTAAELLRLCTEAMKNDRFRKIVSTPQFGYRLHSESGYSRNVRWKNTNQLLEFEGYRGVKTGTTGAAGACLVSVGDHQGQTLMVVVLGSQSSAARYADTRNLYRWAWQRRSDSAESKQRTPKKPASISNQD